MLDVHPVISECDKSDEPEIVAANVYGPPFILIPEIIQAPKKRSQLLRVAKITVAE